MCTCNMIKFPSPTLWVTLQRLSLGVSSEACIWLPSWGDWHRKEDQPPTRPAARAFGFEGQQGLLQELRRPEGNKDLTFKGIAQNLTCTRTKGKSCNFIGVWARPTCWGWRGLLGKKGAAVLHVVMKSGGRCIGDYSSAWTLLKADILLGPLAPRPDCPLTQEPVGF